jgi:hypothetical protein
MKTKRKHKKHNPIKLARLVADYACIVHSGEGRDMVLLDLRSMTQFRPTAHQATVLLNYEHPWSVYTSVKITVSGEESVKTDHHDMKQRYRHCALVEYLTEYHAEQMRRERADHISGFAWICCPSGRDFADDEIKRLYEVADELILGRTDENYY